MTFLFIALFGLLALAAAGFAAWPILTARAGAARWMLAAALACVVLGVGVGLYLFLGSPQIALRTRSNIRDDDWKGMVALLVANARAHPRDPQAWEKLGRGYVVLMDGDAAAGAFRRALPLTPPEHQPAVLDEIGMALTAAANGQVTPDAEAAFALAWQKDPRDVPARFYLGFAYAARRDTAHALSIWQNLLADVPPDSKLHGVLLDRIAQLTAQSGAAPPDIAAMVSGLAARLKQHPDDPDGWQRLVRAYAVLGEGAKARRALEDARVAMAGNANALSALSAEARQLGLEK
jgi:cytochrome c-type biogenesis protein CcmH